VAVTNNSTNVTGTNTVFTQQLSAGQNIQINNVQYMVGAVISNTQFTLATAYAGVTASGLSVIVDPEDLYLIDLMYAVQEYAEKITRRTFLNTTFQTYRDQFDFESTTLRRSRLQQLISVEGLVEGIWNVVDPSFYYTDHQNDYSSLYLQPGQSWPFSTPTYVFQSVRITFIAGYGTSYTAIPMELRTAMLHHIADMYMNRGDCSNCGCALPPQSNAAYRAYRIIDITGEDYSARYG
jgi:uncharacterized phiE125 gp8 family phage protein